MSRMTQTYNAAAIRDLLLVSFTRTDLWRLVMFDKQLAPLAEEISPSGSLSEVVDRIIAYSYRHELVSDLLALIQQANPRQYDRFSHRLMSGAYSPPPLPDLDRLPEPGALPPGSRMPFGRNAIFTGREDALERLARGLLLTDLQALATPVVMGMGGIGKTQLAVEFCYRYGRYFRGVHWVNAAKPGQIEAEIAACGSRMELAPWPQELPAQVARTLTAWRDSGPRLVTLDGLEDVGTARDWLPQLRRAVGRVIVTTRRSDWPQDLGFEPVRLQTFTPEESIHFLRKYLGEARASDEDLLVLHDRLGALPLALELAGRYLHEVQRLSVRRYVEELTSAITHPSMARWRDELGSATGKDLDLAMTFALSWMRVTSSAAQQAFLSAAWCAPNATIPCELLAKSAGLNEDECDEALATLMSLALLEGEATSPLIHPLLNEYGRSIKVEFDPLPAVADALRELTQEAIETGLPERFLPLRAHVSTVAQAAEDAGLPQAGFLWYSLGSHLRDVAEYAGAKTALERALHIYERALGAEHAQVATVVNRLGNVLHNIGDLRGARAAYEQALAIDEAALGPEHPEVVIALNSLGSVLHDLGDLAGAQAAYERALRIAEAVLGPEHPETATGLSNLGVVLRDMGDLAGARAVLERSLALDEAAFGPDHPVVAMRINNMGMVLQDLGDLAGARAAYERALAIDEKFLGPEHPKVAFDINNLGRALHDLGDLAGARAAFERALKLLENQLGPDHPNVATLVNNLGLVLQELGDLAGVQSAFERALAIDEKFLGPEHPNVARDINNLGLVLQDLGNLAGARAAYERALAIDEAAFGPEHTNVARDVSNLGRVLHELGDLAGAQAAYERALRIHDQSLGPHHPRVAEGLSNLGRLLYDVDDVSGAQSAFQRALAIDEKLYRGNHPSVMRHRDDLDMALFDLDNLAAACISGNSVLFCGSALGERAGLPNWATCIENVRRWAVEQNYIDERLDASLRRSIEAGDLNLAADGLVGALKRRGHYGQLSSYLNGTFWDSAIQPTLSHRVLQSIPFSAVLTPNYDQLLEQVGFTEHSVYTLADAESLLDALIRREFFLLKMRGVLHRPETVLFAPSEYQDALAKNRALAQFMSSLFVSRTILFVGATVDEILAYCEGIRLTSGGERHCAVVPRGGDAWEVQAEELQQRYNVQVLTYEASDQSRELAFLQALARSVKARIDAAPAATIGAKRSNLETVRLENIGPFRELTLNLDIDWNILLGDNGLGKSTILKAIALAICGEDARPYASRLLRVGSPSGRVILETTEGARYVTEVRRGAAEAEVTSLPQRPLEIEGWLAIGFPPLRGLDWRPPQGPQLEPRKQASSAADLLPLLTGVPDPRTHELKQWIVNLDYRIAKEQDSYSQRLFDDFFETIGRLTTGMKLKSAKVDPKNYQVTVETDDGEVPIEAVSQGTQSLLSWVGALLERMYEFYDQVDQPREQPVIALVDEIDAHMHPLWQQLIVPTLSKLFPQAQFVATTHSPLVVAEVEPQQVFVLRRNMTTKEIEVEQGQEDPGRLRADQILTSDLFRLSTTRSKRRGVSEQVAEYSRLLGLPERTDAQQARLEALRTELQAQLTAAETPLQRRVENAIKDALTQIDLSTAVPSSEGGEDLPPEFALEIKRQLDELLDIDED